MPSVFPDGLHYMNQKLELPFIAHNRYWDPKNIYAKQNGGKYDFVVEEVFSLPIEQQFWDDLLGEAATWGLRVYEQDWLVTAFEGLAALQTQLELGREWLIQMGEGARKHGITVQYCMPLPRHVLQSVEVPAVKQVRATDDNTPGTENWKNTAFSGIVEYALGLAPFKGQHTHCD